jgi:ABC-type dipeptide/oligopeptide/nickel transport system permease subunit
VKAFRGRSGFLAGAGFAIVAVSIALVIGGLRESAQWSVDVWAGGFIGQTDKIVQPPFPPFTCLSLFDVNLQTHARHCYLMGSDVGGRDLLALVARGAIPSLELVVLVVAARFGVGTAIGVGMGFGSRPAREAARALGSVLVGFPYLVLAAVAIQGVVPKGKLLAFIVGMSLVGWRDIAELVSGRVEYVRSQSFALAAVAIGTGPIRFFLLHVAPFLRTSLGVELPFQLSGVLILLAELGFIQVFLGPTIGLQNQGGPPTILITTPELGQLLSLTRGYILAGQFWPAIVPALFIALLAIGFELIGTAVRGQTRAGG